MPVSDPEGLVSVLEPEVLDSVPDSCRGTLFYDGDYTPGDDGDESTTEGAVGGFCVGKDLFLFVKIKCYLGVEEKREKGKTPNPQTQNRNSNPNTKEENGKKREGQEKTEGNRQRPFSSLHR